MTLRLIAIFSLVLVAMVAQTSNQPTTAASAPSSVNSGRPTLFGIDMPMVVSLFGAIASLIVAGSGAYNAQKAQVMAQKKFEIDQKATVRDDSKHILAEYRNLFDEFKGRVEALQKQHKECDERSEQLEKRGEEMLAQLQEMQADLSDSHRKIASFEIQLVQAAHIRDGMMRWMADSARTLAELKGETIDESFASPEGFLPQKS